MNRPKSEIFDRPNSSTPTNRQYKEYLQSFDRRHSDSNCIINQSSSCEKINLADEIKKLSDRLMMLSSINDELNEYNSKLNSDTVTNPANRTKESTQRINGTDAENNNDKSPIDLGTDETFSESTPSQRPRSETPTREPAESETSQRPQSPQNNSAESVKLHASKQTEGTETVTNIRNSNHMEWFNRSTSRDESSSRSYKSNTFIRSKSVLSNDTYSSSTVRGSSVVNDLTERLRALDDTPSLFRKMVSSRNVSESVSINRNRKSTTNGTAYNYAHDSLHGSSATHGKVPWSVNSRRTKFRVTQMSRDVPVGSPDSHQTVFLDEAAHTTKDCLLQLLEKYNGRGTRSLSTIGRHQSISVGYGISDNLEYRSMNSLNAFFKRNAHIGNTVKQIQARMESKQK